MNQVRSFEAQAMPQLKNLYRTALYLTNSESGVQELVQESIVKSYSSWHKEKIKPNCRIWLFRNMADAFISKFQPSSGLSNATSNGDHTNGHRGHSQSVNLEPGNFPDEASLAAISESDVKNAITNLPGDYRLVVVLSLLEDFSYQEIVEIAGLRLEAVRFRLHQGRRLMNERFFSIGRAKTAAKCHKQSQEEK